MKIVEVNVLHSNMDPNLLGPDQIFAILLPLLPTEGAHI
jgi:hypothetical protein